MVTGIPDLSLVSEKQMLCPQLDTPWLGEPLSYGYTQVTVSLGPRTVGCLPKEDIRNSKICHCFFKRWHHLWSLGNKNRYLPFVSIPTSVTTCAWTPLLRDHGR